MKKITRNVETNSVAVKSFQKNCGNFGKTFEGTFTHKIDKKKLDKKWIERKEEIESFTKIFR